MTIKNKEKDKKEKKSGRLTDITWKCSLVHLADICRGGVRVRVRVSRVSRVSRGRG